MKQFLMRKRAILFVFVLCVVAGFAGLATTRAVGGKEPVLWSSRCDAPDEASQKPPACEIFQTLDVKETGKRFAEFAIGTPDANGVSRGVAILPLGMLLEPGVTMQIDEGKSFVFNARYCVPQGCYGFLDLNPELLQSMQTGKELSFRFASITGKTFDVRMSLSGFEKALGHLTGS